MTYDDLLRKVHGSRYERKMFVVYLLNGLPNALFISSLALVMYTPSNYRCTLPEVAENFLNKNQTSANSTLNYFIPFDPNAGERSKCTRYNRSAEEITQFIFNLQINNSSSVAMDTAATISCDKGHHFENPLGINSIAIEYDWTCENAWLKPVISMGYFLGKSLAAFAGFASDRFGRRPLFIAFTFILFIIGFLESFSTSTMMYAVFAFFSGLSSLVNFIAGFVLGAECTIPERRNFISISSFVSYAFSSMITTLVFYLTSDWRWSLRIYGLIGLLYIPNLWLINESPRWLMANGNIAEGKNVLRRIAKYNNKPDEAIERMLEDVDKEAEALKCGERSLQQKTIRRKIFKDIAKSPAMLATVFVVAYSWFSIALVYYGITLSVTGLSGNVYVNNALMGLLEIPGTMLAFLAVKYMSRPISHGGMMILTAGFCIGASLLNQVSPIAATAAGILGKAISSGAFYIVYIHTAEIFPTIVRNSCMSCGSFIGRVGTLVSPYFTYLVDLYGIYAPFLLMSLLTATSGLLTLLIFPETRDIELPETVADSISLKRDFHASNNTRAKTVMNSFHYCLVISPMPFRILSKFCRRNEQRKSKESKEVEVVLHEAEYEA